MAALSTTTTGALWVSGARRMRDPVTTISWLLTVVTGTVCEGTTPCAAAAAAEAAAGTPIAVSATPARRIVSNRFMHSPFFSRLDPGLETLVRIGGILTEM